MSALSKVKIELNSEGIKELLHSEGIRAALAEAGERVQARAGDGYDAFPVEMPGRSIVRVSATTSAARKDNSDNNTLVRALFGG